MHEQIAHVLATEALNLYSLATGLRLREDEFLKGLLGKACAIESLLKVFVGNVIKEMNKKEEEKGDNEQR